MNPDISSPLSERARRFVRAYIGEASGNATKAAKLAGYKGSAKTLAVQGTRLLMKANVQAALRQRAERADLTPDRILEEVRRIAFSDIRQFFDEQGRLRPIHELPESVAGALSSIEVTKGRTQKQGESTTDETVTKVKVWDKLKALELAGKVQGLWNDAQRESNRITVNIGFLQQPDGQPVVIQQTPKVMASHAPVALISKTGEKAGADQ